MSDRTETRDRTETAENRTPDSARGTRRLNGPEFEEIERKSGPATSRAKWLWSVGGNVPRSSVLVAVVLVVVAGSVAAVAGPAVPDGANPFTQEETSPVASGEHLAGSLAGHQESIDRNLSSFELSAKLDRSNASAETLARECGQLEDWLAELETRSGRLEARRENGTVTRGEFRAGMTALQAEARTVRRLARECIRHTATIPDEELRAAGVNVTELQALVERTDRFVGRNLTDHALADSGVRYPDGNLTVDGGTFETFDGNRSINGTSASLLEQGTLELAILEAQYEEALALVSENASTNETALDALECARTHLDDADTAFESAREALADENATSYETKLGSAFDAMETAEECIEQSFDAVGE